MIFMTGANGKVGRALRLESESFIPIDVDVRDAGTLDRLFEKMHGQRVRVVHLAGTTDVDFCEENKRLAWEVNVNGTKNLLNSMERFCPGSRLLYVSSCHVFDGTKYFPYTEKHALSPVNFYGSTKLGAEALLSSAASVEVLVGRLGKLYTPDFFSEIKDRTSPVPSFIKRNFISPEMLAYYVIRSFDVNIKRFPKSPLGVSTINLAAGENMSNHMFYNSIRRTVGLSELPERKLEVPGMTPRPYRCEMSDRNTRRLLK